MFGKKNKVHPRFDPNYFSNKEVKKRDRRDTRNVNFAIICVIIFIGIFV
tara:strand:- start:132 stop:278 length:147 start_codon:yes stop_codon:yes gene_type:complete